MKTYELSADVVGALAASAPRGLWNQVTYSGGVLEVPDDVAAALDLDTPNTIASAERDGLIRAAAAKRWAVETGGVTVNGEVIDTSRESQAMITGAYNWSNANPSEPIKFKAASGWIVIDNATMVAIADAVGAHVQACFATEAAVAAEIKAGTITTTAEIDAADWPS